MRKLKYLLPCLTLALAACNNDDTQEVPAQKADTPMSVSTEITFTRAMITDTQFGDGAQLGITLVDNEENATSYDGLTQGYHNVLYTASTDAQTSKQVWTSTEPILLSGTDGKAVAYYPYNANNNDYTSIPVNTMGQTDYMYSGWVSSISNSRPDAVFTMKHALAAVRVRVLKGSYTGEGKVTSVNIASDAFGTVGTLDASTGALSSVTVAEVNTGMMANPSFTALTLDKAEKQSALLMVLPVPDKTANVSMSLTVDGKVYTATGVMTDEFKQGHIYTFDLTLDNTTLNASQVIITQWVEDSSATTENGGVLKPGTNN